MKLKATLAILLAFSFVGGFAKNITSHVGEVKNGYNFWLSEPESAKEEKPVVIFLHGASLCGTNLEKVKRYGTLDAVEKGREIDAYVIAPQNPGGAWKPEKIMNVLEWVENNYNVDKNRVYVVGMSLGGHGTLSFTATYPDKVAAALAMCGGSIFEDASKLNDVPLWIVHGTADKAVSISGSDKVVARMKQDDPQTPRLVYDRVPGMNHSQPARVFYMEDTYEWLFSHNLTDNDRPVAPTFTLTSGKMSSAYQGLKFNSTKKATVSKKKSSATKKKSSVSTKRKKKSGTLASHKKKKAISGTAKKKSRKSTKRRS